MFTQKITYSDAFLDMPLSAQALYFHLNMMADDDGFINNAKRIKNTIGATDEDLDLLHKNRFLIGFENGVVVVKHWRMHNTLRKDRYNPTQYQEELALLEVKDNKAYTEKCDGNQMATKWQPNGNQMATQYSKGKCSIDKDREEEGVDDSASIEAEPTPPTKRTDYQQIVDMFHNLCPSYSSVKKISDARKKAIKARLNAYSIEDFKTLFEKAEASDFLKGANDRNWQATFDWLIKDANMAKVLDGNYDNKKKQPATKRNGFNNFTGRGYTRDELSAMERLLHQQRHPAPTVDDDANLKAEADELQRMLQEKYAKSV